MGVQLIAESEFGVAGDRGAEAVAGAGESAVERGWFFYGVTGSGLSRMCLSRR